MKCGIKQSIRESNPYLLCERQICADQAHRWTIFSFMLTMIAWKQHDAKLTGVSRAPTGNRTRIIPIPRERNSHYNTISANKMETNVFKTLLHHWPDDNWTHCFHECGRRDSNPRFRHGEAAILTESAEPAPASRHGVKRQDNKWIVKTLWKPSWEFC